MKVNVWKSIYTGQIYEMPTDFIPKYSNGWVLIDTKFVSLDVIIK